MLPPIRPSPIIPSCITPSWPLSGQNPYDRLAQFGKARGDVRSEMDAQGAAAALGQDVEIATRLRRLHDTESVFLARHRQILAIIAGDLQEDAGIRAALVGLPGRVQEPRPEA